MSAQQGRHIYGILAPPRVSRNQNLYLPSQLAMGDNKSVDLFDEHEDFEMGPEGRPTGRILGANDGVNPRGQVTLHWNREMQRLEYDGHVWDKRLIELIKSGKRPFVSLAAEPQSVQMFQGYKVPMGLNFFSVATVANPGIPETTVNMEQMLREDYLRLPIATRVAARFVVCEGVMEHDFDDAIAALQAIDQIIDKQKAKAGHGTGVQPAGPQSKGPQVSEPMHQDFQQVKGGMQKQYGDKADDVYYTWKNKYGLDDTKPMPGNLPSGAKEELGTIGDQLRQALAAQNSQSGQQGVGFPAGMPSGGPLPPPTMPGSGVPGTGVDPTKVGVDKDPHLGGTGAPGVSGTGNITPMQGDGTNPTAAPPIQKPGFQNPWLTQKEGTKQPLFNGKPWDEIKDDW